MRVLFCFETLYNKEKCPSVNPYDPQRPSPPGSFAGRAKLIQTLREYLERAQTRRSSGSLLIHGHRGTGKTSALRKIEALTEDSAPDALAVDIPLHQASSDADLLRSIVQEITSYVRRKRTEKAGWSRIIERLEQVHVSVLGSGVEVARRHPIEDRNALTMWRECLEAIREAPVLTICIDDADRLTAAGVGTLKTIAEAQVPLPVILVVAGGPELMRRLATHEFSPVARVFSGGMFDMDAFTEEETRDALESPLRGEPDAGAWTSEGVRRVHQLSHGYPYLVKCIAHAVYRPRATLDAAAVESAIPNALETAAPWLDRELPEASDGDIRAFVRIVRGTKTHLTASEIGYLGVNSVYTKRLVKLEVLRQVAPGRYELRKAPAIAYYHELRRKLE